MIKKVIYTHKRRNKSIGEKQFKKFYKTKMSCDRKYWCDFLWLLLTINRFILLKFNKEEKQKRRKK